MHSYRGARIEHLVVFCLVIVYPERYIAGNSTETEVIGAKATMRRFKADRKRPHLTLFTQLFTNSDF